MIENSVNVFFYEDKITYKPKYIVTFQIDNTISKDDCEISIGIGNTRDSIAIEKKFGDFTQKSGSTNFPNNIIVFDITEMESALQAYNTLFLKVKYSGSAPIISFSLETYDGVAYPTDLDDTDISVSLNTLYNDAYYAEIDISAISGGAFSSSYSNNSRTSVKGINDIFNIHLATDSEMSQLRAAEGIYSEYKNYSPVINGHGTGLIPPTEKQWQELKGNLYSVDSVKYLSAGINQFGSANFVDHSTSPYFPPIGNQGGENSCVSWAVAYYIKTFQEAREHLWDLSAATWDVVQKEPSPAYQDRIFSPDFIFHQLNGGNGSEGSYFHDNIKAIIKNGCSTWIKFPNNDEDLTGWPNETAWREAPLYRGETSSDTNWNPTYYYISVNTYDDIRIIRILLDNNKLAFISVNANYYYSMTEDDVWNTDNYNVTSINHANTIVGYMDD